MSIVVLVLTVLVVLAANIFGLIAIGYLDKCPPERCSSEGAFAAVAASLMVAAVIAAVGLTVTVVRLRRRRRAWPIAVATLALCLVACAIGGIGYAIAVSA